MIKLSQHTTFGQIHRIQRENDPSVIFPEIEKPTQDALPIKGRKDSCNIKWMVDGDMVHVTKFNLHKGSADYKFTLSV